MKELTKQQLKAIEELSARVIYTRGELAEALCEALGEDFTWARGYVNGHSNSIVLFYGGKHIVQIGTYRYKDPKSVSIKYILYGDYAYDFDYYGKVINAMKKVEIREGNCITVKYESIIAE